MSVLLTVLLTLFLRVALVRESKKSEKTGPATVFGKPDIASKCKECPDCDKERAKCDVTSPQLCQCRRRKSGLVAIASGLAARVSTNTEQQRFLDRILPGRRKSHAHPGSHGVGVIGHRGRTVHAN